MRAREFVPLMAEKFGIDPSHLEVIDRGLVKAGLREKSIGRTFPEMNVREALTLLLAYMSAAPAVHAAQAASALMQARAVTWTTQVPDLSAALMGEPEDQLQGITLLEALDRIAGRLAKGTRIPVGLEVRPYGASLFFGPTHKGEVFFGIGAHDVGVGWEIETIRRASGSHLMWIAEKLAV